MSRSGWRKHPKTRLIGGLVVALSFCVGWIGYGLSQSAEYERQARAKAEEYSRYTSDKVAQACVGISALERIRCVNDAIEAQREYEYNQADLVAQRQSALWAYIMAAAAIIGMVLSAVGVWLVWTTFRETQLAARAAMQTLILASRPKFEFNAAHLTVKRGQDIDGEVLVENVGNSVATISYGSIGFKTYRRLPGKNPINEFGDMNKAPWDRFVPQPRWWKVVWTGLSDQEFDDIERKRATLYLIGRLVYSFEGLDERPEIHTLFAFAYCPRTERWNPVSDRHYFRVGD